MQLSMSQGNYLLYVTDALSRAPLPDTMCKENLQSEVEELIDAVTTGLTTTGLTMKGRLEEISSFQACDPVCSQLIKCCKFGWLDKHHIEGHLKVFWSRRGHLTVHKGLLMYGDRIVVLSILLQLSGCVGCGVVLQPQWLVLYPNLGWPCMHVVTMAVVVLWHVKPRQLWHGQSTVSVFSFHAGVFTSGTWPLLSYLEDSELRWLAQVTTSNCAEEQGRQHTTKDILWGLPRDGRQRLPNFPVQELHLVLYMQHLSESTEAKAAIEEAVHALSWLHGLAGLQPLGGSPNNKVA